jgi:hypothetical protein
LCGHFSAERLPIDVVDEGALAVDLHDRQPLAVSRLQLGVAADVDLVEVEGHLAADLFEDPTGALAEVAALRVVQRDSLYG